MSTSGATTSVKSVPKLAETGPDPKDNAKDNAKVTEGERKDRLGESKTALDPALSFEPDTGTDVQQAWFSGWFAANNKQIPTPDPECLALLVFADGELKMQMSVKEDPARAEETKRFVCGPLMQFRPVQDSHFDWKLKLGPPERPPETKPGQKGWETTSGSDDADTVWFRYGQPSDKTPDWVRLPADDRLTVCLMKGRRCMLFGESGLFYHCRREGCSQGGRIVVSLKKLVMECASSGNHVQFSHDPATQRLAVDFVEVASSAFKIPDHDLLNPEHYQFPFHARLQMVERHSNGTAMFPLTPVLDIVKRPERAYRNGLTGHTCNAQWLNEPLRLPVKPSSPSSVSFTLVIENKQRPKERYPYELTYDRRLSRFVSRDPIDPTTHATLTLDKDDPSRVLFIEVCHFNFAK